MTASAQTTSHTPPLNASECAIILVNYQEPSDTLDCLAALQHLAHPPHCIIVVDNGSAPQHRQALQHGWEQLTATNHTSLLRMQNPVSLPQHTALDGNILLELPDNTGFSGGNNAALRLALQRTSCRAFWLLNNDTLPDRLALDTLCARLNTLPHAGLCGSTLLCTHPKNTLQCAAGGTFSRWTGASHHILESISLDAAMQASVTQIEQELEYIVGASLLLRREVLENAGCLPEEYFLYYEDVAFSLMARQKNYALAWAQDSLVCHKEGASSRSSSHATDSPQHATTPERSLLIDYLSLRNRAYCIRTFYPASLPILILSFAGVWLNRIRRGQITRTGLVIKALWHGLTGNMGKPSQNK